MKWIKAIERLPEKKTDDISEDNGIIFYNEARISVELIFMSVAGNLSFLGNLEHWKWLDESIKGEDAPSEQDELWDEVESIFDKHTSPTGGGYEADYTDRQSFLEELKQSFTITRKP